MSCDIPVDDFERDGFCVVRDVLDESDMRMVADVLRGLSVDRAQRADDTYGARNLLADERIRALGESPCVRDLAGRLAGTNMRTVRGLFFDKTPAANWPVPWHQDLVVALAERVDLAGWGPWSIKAGVHHAEAPVAVLARMVTLRLHLDDCDDSNGPLRVLPGSQQRGRLRHDDIARLRLDVPERAVLAQAGDAIAIRPLLAHASSPAKAPRHRRVLHLEFAPDDLLPAPLRWAN